MARRTWKWSTLAVLCVLAFAAFHGSSGAARSSAGADPPKTITNDLGMTFVLIPAGAFLMGSSDGEPGRRADEGPRRRVTITRPFYMQTTEVTQGQFRKIIGETPFRFKNCGDDCPAEGVSWNYARAFIRVLNKKEGREVYRLPTEAEWEYAARAGSDAATYAGPLVLRGANHAPVLDAIAWYSGDSCASYPKAHDCSDLKEKAKNCPRCGPQPAGRAKPNAFGLYDMLGNVWEWCQDVYDPAAYGRLPVQDPKNEADGERVCRGGGWADDPTGVRAAARFHGASGTRRDDLGFRVVRIAP